ncbi:UDP-N-acetylmuramate dehydrogenase [Fulvivirga sp. RKSG066]|uniref:UDP-N-acetylmuramate dehydrogenase n=1 Tax=Fulvivirga aurantia TaxID=2529383 RepID=UPI0012BB711A|nr:UDP-N-acetylmuramate dehydrogenase [Fulvivirga aurantia]MTI22107.1 UDP-N-acetylmuramate dehydrogenase [Fulvivirga aurantia]
MQIEKNISLKPYNTFGLEAKARYFTEAQSIEDLQAILKTSEAQDNEVLLLGGGSNILLTKDFDGLVIKIDIKGIELQHENNEEVVVKVGAGENWHEFVLEAIKNNWGGVENLSLIPGTMGAAPMQNIGAYGVEIKEVFDYLLAVNRKTGKVEKFNNTDCQFGYRESIFKNVVKGEYIIAEVVLRLSNNEHKLNTSYGAIADTLKEMGIDKPTIKDISDAVIKIRQSKLPDPKKIGNSGSFFKNPTIDKIDYEGLKAEFSDIPGYELPEDKIKVPAGWLIEQCGWKGKKIGDIGVHDKQALVLVNHGGGKGEDIWDLAQEIQKSVAEKFGISLNPEVNVIR